jgi:hypothetical protein
MKIIKVKANNNGNDLGEINLSYDGNPWLLAYDKIIYKLLLLLINLEINITILKSLSWLYLVNLLR